MANQVQPQWLAPDFFLCANSRCSKAGNTQRHLLAQAFGVFLFFGVRKQYSSKQQWPRYPLQAPPKNTGGGFPLLSGVGAVR
jgi:hypothetical protein